MIVDIDREVKFLEPSRPRLFDRPVGQRYCDPATVMLLEDVELAKLDRARGRFDRKRRRTELHIADDRVARLSYAEAIAQICKFLRPGLGREFGQEISQVVRSVEMRERVAETLLEHAIDSGEIL